MAEPVIFPDTGLLFTGFLRDELLVHGWAVEVRTTVPAVIDREFVRVLALGGQRRNIITDSVTVTIEAWAETKIRAAELSQVCRALVVNADVIGGVQLSRVDEYASPAPLPYPDSPYPRYAFTLAVGVSGTAL